MDEMKVFAGVVQYIKVEMGVETFGIDISYVDNIVRMQNITRVPDTPDDRRNKSNTNHYYQDGPNW